MSSGQDFPPLLDLHICNDTVGAIDPQVQVLCKSSVLFIDVHLGFSLLFHLSQQKGCLGLTSCLSCSVGEPETPMLASFHPSHVLSQVWLRLLKLSRIDSAELGAFVSINYIPASPQSNQTNHCCHSTFHTMLDYQPRKFVFLSWEQVDSFLQLIDDPFSQFQSKTILFFASPF